MGASLGKYMGPALALNGLLDIMLATPFLQGQVEDIIKPLIKAQGKEDPGAALAITIIKSMAAGIGLVRLVAGLNYNDSTAKVAMASYLSECIPAILALATQHPHINQQAVVPLAVLPMIGIAALLKATKGPKLKPN
mmetsp:Transcript_1214/g.1924  ORF Transcript_1214/g.1924 Transcript_1214/m.1924 type:complete len:137 (+) Transcript_1214:93-503(+)|eukprot:CAMPEP_0184526934 /NCGR_PEP_ID=MMETSP0198_2-20121128/10926_1 /TAXON_ID=1112570 /ORGANISM="Thraustochytrium sp., Strain LLF1b" /LENGTH=136 /DNA_ID=CAMNT_0026918553 /DNA_START=73 /DNA_END=483 /DNA_ORIENTATION=-